MGDGPITAMTLAGIAAAQEVICVTCVTTTLHSRTSTVGQSTVAANARPAEEEEKDDDGVVHEPP